MYRFYKKKIEEKNIYLFYMKKPLNIYNVLVTDFMYVYTFFLLHIHINKFLCLHMIKLV